MAHTTCFGMPDVCSAKGEWIKHGIERHEMRDSNNVQVPFMLGEELIKKLLLSKDESLIRDEVG